LPQDGGGHSTALADHVKGAARARHRGRDTGRAAHRTMRACRTV